MSETTKSDISQPHHFEESTTTRYGFEFNGTTGEYFRIWIVNLFLSIVTLGIYSAWAKVRTKRYFYGNTFLHGSSFDYTANPLQILKGRLIAVGLLAAYQAVSYFWPQFGGFALTVLVVFAPLIIVLSLRFRMRNTVWRGIRFGFNADIKKAYWLFLPPILYFFILAIIPFILGLDITLLESEDEIKDPEDILTIFSYLKAVGVLVLIATLIFPWWQNKYYDFIGNRSRFGESQFSLRVTVGQFYRMYLVAVLIMVVGGFCSYVLLKGILIPAGFPNNEFLSDIPFLDGRVELIMSIFISFLFFSLYLLTLVYVFTHKTNLLYSHLYLNKDEIEFHCRLSTRYMLYLYFTNTLAILLSLGLAVPWAMIRTTKYRAEKISMMAPNLETFLANQRNENNAVGEEVGEMFGLDIGL